MTQQHLEIKSLKSAQKIMGQIVESDLKLIFKQVNAMLQVLDRDGIHGMLLYMAAYGKNEQFKDETARQLFKFLQENAGLTGNPRGLQAVRKEIENHLKEDDITTDLAVLFLRRTLVHLRLELKAREKELERTKRTAS